MFTVKKTIIPGCLELQPHIFEDTRGKFVKVFHHNEFSKLNLETSFTEEFYSQSRGGVIRGMHFQMPPFENNKVVYCVDGEVHDVILDLRIGSPTYRKAVVISLSAQQGNFIYIPKGLAHGFYARSKIAILVYKVSSVYNPQNDSGILWNSFGHNWPTTKPIISKRDANFMSLDKFESPFLYE